MAGPSATPAPSSASPKGKKSSVCLVSELDWCLLYLVRMASSFHSATTLQPRGFPPGLLPMHYVHFCVLDGCLAHLPSRPVIMGTPKISELFLRHIPPPQSPKSLARRSVGMRPTTVARHPPAASEPIPVCPPGSGGQLQASWGRGQSRSTSSSGLLLSRWETLSKSVWQLSE